MRNCAYLRVIGVVLMATAMLGTAIAWRGGFHVATQYLFLFLLGAILFGIGAISWGNDNTLPHSPDCDSSSQWPDDTNS